MGKLLKNSRKPGRRGRKITVGKVESVPPGRSATVQLKGGAELAIFNVDGTFHAVENFCPHKGYPLADSILSDNTIECVFHGWRFDVRSGECFTKKNCSIESFKVVVEDGWIKILV